MEPEAVLDTFVVEVELIGAAAVIGRGIAREFLRAVDMPETGEVYAGAVDGRREYDNVLPREEGAAVVGLAAGDGVMGHEDARDALVELRRKPEQNVVDERGSVAVLGLLVRSGAEQPQAAFVEAGEGQNLNRPGAGGEFLDARRGVDVEVLFVLGDFPHSLEGAGIVVVLGAEQQDDVLAAAAQRSDEFCDGVVHVVEGGVGPDAGAVEQVSGDDGDVRRLRRGPLRDVLHAGDGVLSAGVFTVPNRPRKVSEVDVGGVQNLHVNPPLANGHREVVDILAASDAAVFLPPKSKFFHSPDAAGVVDRRMAVFLCLGEAFVLHTGLLPSFDGALSQFSIADAVMRYFAPTFLLGISPERTSRRIALSVSDVPSYSFAAAAIVGTSVLLFPSMLIGLLSRPSPPSGSGCRGSARTCARCTL